jgi:hypothetical protein
VRIVGVCRFSLLGRGDWVAWRGRPEAESEAETEATLAHAAARLFAPARLEARLSNF